MTNIGLSLSRSANERTLSSGKKTILPDDVFEALDDIEYSQFRDRLQAEFKSTFLLAHSYYSYIRPVSPSYEETRREREVMFVKQYH